MEIALYIVGYFIFGILVSCIIAGLSPKGEELNSGEYIVLGLIFLFWPVVLVIATISLIFWLISLIFWLILVSIKFLGYLIKRIADLIMGIRLR